MFYSLEIPRISPNVTPWRIFNGIRITVLEGLLDSSLMKDILSGISDARSSISESEMPGLFALAKLSTIKRC